MRSPDTLKVQVRRDPDSNLWHWRVVTTVGEHPQAEGTTPAKNRDIATNYGLQWINKWAGIKPPNQR